MHHLDDVRLLCSAGLASGDAADTAADTAGLSTIIIAGKVAAVAFCHASLMTIRSPRVLRCTGAGGTLGTQQCSILRMFSCVGALEVAVGVHGDVLHRLRRMARLFVWHTCRPWVGPGGDRREV